MKLIFRILLLIFGVVEVLLLSKYLDQSIIERFQKFKSKFFSGIQQDISSTNNNKDPSKNVKKEEESKETELILKKNGPCDCLKPIDLGISDEFINSTTCSRVGISKQILNKKILTFRLYEIYLSSIISSIQISGICNVW